METGSHLRLLLREEKMNHKLNKKEFQCLKD